MYLAVWFRRCFYALRAVWKTNPWPLPQRTRILVTLRLLGGASVMPVWLLLWKMDDVLFPSYREQQVKKPVFIISGPRTGSTRLHRLLNLNSEGFISPTGIEMFFPFLVVLIPMLKLHRLDKRLFCGFLSSSCQRLLALFIPKAIFKAHETNLLSTEEDDWWFYRWHLLGMFTHGHYPIQPLLANAWPELTERDVCGVMDMYHAWLQKLLYLRGRGRRLLSKSHGIFWMEHLKKRYEDPAFITMLRDPYQSIQSSLSIQRMMLQWKAWLDTDNHSEVPRWHCRYLLDYYRSELKLLHERTSDFNSRLVLFSQLLEAPEVVMQTICRSLDVGIDKAYQERLEEEYRKQQRFHSLHKYGNNSFDLGSVDPMANELLADYARQIKQQTYRLNA